MDFVHDQLATGRKLRVLIPPVKNIHQITLRNCFYVEHYATQARAPERWGVIDAWLSEVAIAEDHSQRRTSRTPQPKRLQPRIAVESWCRGTQPR